MGSSYDVLIIGSGAGGGTLAYRLASTGKKILLLERGDFLPRERENWDPYEVFHRGRYLAPETWRDAGGLSFQPYTHYFVGGNTKMYGAALLRLRERDFAEVEHYGGISPAWPIGYHELEPYYTEAEQLYSVHGQRGIDPTEPPASVPLPYPGVPYEPRMAEFAAELVAAGLAPFPIPLGVRLPSDHRRTPGPRYTLSNFDGFPDLTEVKADAQVVAVEPALQHPNVTLLTRAKVERLETDPSGRSVRQVVVQRDGEELRFFSDLVVLACGAVNSAALLLRSSSDRHPRGLANGSDQVGRNYMTHHNGALVLLSPSKENPAQFQKSFGLADFYYGAEDSKLPLGLVQTMGKMDHDWLESLGREVWPGASAATLSRHAVEFFLTAEDLPSPTNRVRLAADGAIEIHYRDTNAEAYERLYAKVVEKLAARPGRPLDEVYVGGRLGIGGVSHQSGTLRMGKDPATSVVDTNNKAHELDNLYTADSSFFPSCGAVNPSLTIMANALRVGDILRARLG